MNEPQFELLARYGKDVNLIVWRNGREEYVTDARLARLNRVHCC